MDKELTMKAGKSLERLVEHLEQAITDNQNLMIESPKRLRDKVTGQLREHDVVLTFKEQHHELQIAFECRDRSRKVTVEQVEAFSRKCEDTGISQGILVSPKGFYKTALKKAEAAGIRCLSIEEATAEFDWLSTNELPELIPHIRRMSVRATLDQGNILNVEGNHYLSDSNLNRIPNDYWLKLVSELLFDVRYMSPDGPAHRETTFHLDSRGAFISDELTNNHLPIQQLIIDVEYEIEVQLHPFQLLKYSDKNNQADIADVALSKLPFGDTSVDVGIVYRPGKGAKLIVIEEKSE